MTKFCQAFQPINQPLKPTFFPIHSHFFRHPRRQKTEGGDAASERPAGQMLKKTNKQENLGGDAKPRSG